MTAPYAPAVATTPPKGQEGPERHIALNTHEHLLMVNLTAAGCEKVASGRPQAWLWLKHSFAGGTFVRYPAVATVTSLYAGGGRNFEVTRYPDHHIAREVSRIDSTKLGTSYFN